MYVKEHSNSSYCFLVLVRPIYTGWIEIEIKMFLISVLACIVVILATCCCVYIVRLSRVSGHMSRVTSRVLCCLSEYSEVESKPCDEMSTTTIQVKWVELSKIEYPESFLLKIRWNRDMKNRIYDKVNRFLISGWHEKGEIQAYYM